MRALLKTHFQTFASFFKGELGITTDQTDFLSTIASLSKAKAMHGCGINGDGCGIAVGLEDLKKWQGIVGRPRVIVR